MISVEKYIEIISLPKDMGLIDYQIEIISIYYDLDPVEVGQWKMSELKSQSKHIIDIIRTIEDGNHQLNETISTQIGDLYFKPLNAFTLGEYIDLEAYLKNDDLLSLLTLIYRRKEIVDYSRDIWEEWGGYTKKRHPLFNQINIMDVIGGVKTITNQKSEFIKAYSSIFVEDNFDYDEEIAKAKTPEEKRIIQEEKRKDEVNKSFNFEFLILNVANNDFTKIDQVVDMNVNVVFKFLLTRKQAELINK